MIWGGTVGAQTQWQKYSGNPILVKSNPIYEFYAIGQPTCLVVNDTFKMWYCGAGIDHRARVLHAYSTNGTTWTKYGGGTPVIDVGGAGSWDSHWLDTPEILQDPGGFKLYYFGNTSDTVQTSQGIGLATSTNGINWQKHANNPVFSKGDSLAWDGFWIESPAVLLAGDTFRMWYSGAARDWKIRIGYATSTDGVFWTKHPANPVIDLGLPGTWEDYMVAVASVVSNGSRYEMWYCGVSAADLSNGVIDTPRVGYAYSANGLIWTKYSGNPVLSMVDPPRDTLGPWAPSVVSYGGGYRMWYETGVGFGYATAPTSIESDPAWGHRVDLAIAPSLGLRHARIIYSIAKAGRVTICIFDTRGCLVRRLIEHEARAGRHVLTWNGRNDHGRPVSSGVYFCALQGNETATAKKFVILR